jgi:hypothetical protein
MLAMLHKSQFYLNLLLILSVGVHILTIPFQSTCRTRSTKRGVDAADKSVVYRLETARLNKYREFRSESLSCSLPQGKASQPVLLKVKWNDTQVLSSDEVYKDLAKIPRPYMEKAIPIEWPAVFDQYRRRPRAVMFLDFSKMMPTSVRMFVQV